MFQPHLRVCTEDAILGKLTLVTESAVALIQHGVSISAGAEGETGLPEVLQITGARVEYVVQTPLP